MRLTAGAPAKVNLSLFLGPLREDGRHQLVTLFESVSLCDELVVTTAPEGADRVICAEVEGPNLVEAALAGLRDRGWEAPPVRVEITKRIPVAAGMGGGSADAAALLRIAPQLAAVPAAELEVLAGELGADVPGQLVPGLALGTGAGEMVIRLEPMAAHALAIVPLPEQLSTAAVYAEADRLGLPGSEEELDARLQEVDSALQPGAPLPATLIVNELEPAARSLCPQIDAALEAVREEGADHALVCGSGPTVAGVFWGEAGVENAKRAAAEVSAHFPRATVVVPVMSSPASGTIQ